MGQDTAQAMGGDGGAARDVPPSEAEGDEALCGQKRVAVAVVLKRAPGAVASMPVDLDDELRPRPEKVHGQVVQRGVYKRLGKAVFPA